MRHHQPENLTIWDMQHILELGEIFMSELSQGERLRLMRDASAYNDGALVSQYVSFSILDEEGMEIDHKEERS